MLHLSTLFAVISCASALTVPLSPANCSEGDCFLAFRAAAQQCASHGPQCDILLEPGRYRASCPTYSGLYAYVRTPGAVDLSNLSGVSFGAASPAAPAHLDVDYLGAGCPAIAAWHANNVTLRNLVLDTTRLPFTEGSVAKALDGGRVVQIEMWDAEHAAFDVRAYPWLLSGWDWFGYVGPNLTGFVSSAWDASLGVATLTFPEPDASRAASVGAHVLCKHFLNLQSWGVYGLGVTGTFLLQDIKLLSSGGMGLRCDFCRGDWTGIRASVGAAGLNRSLSTTADGVHFMHHAGRITLQNSTIDSTGDDCFNAHGNFIVLMDVALSGDRRRASYIDETGPGWLPEAATLLVGDAIQFYSRLTLEPLGEPTVLLAATGGFGPNATLFFQDPIPLSVLPYDMLLSLDRRPALVAEGNTFLPGGGGTQESRGMVVSALGVRIVNNTFQGLGATSILFMNGGCGAYEDYTEGPFSGDVLIAGNSFLAADPRHSTDRVGGGLAVVQATACTPTTCKAVPAPPTEPYPMPPCAPGGSSQPPVRPHLGDPDGPGRVNEGGSALMAAPGRKLFRNISVVGNHFSSSSRFLDLGLADGIRIEGNVFMATPGWGSPSNGALCVYGSTGFNSTATVLQNRCLNGSQPVVCDFCADHERR